MGFEVNFVIIQVLNCFEYIFFVRSNTTQKVFQTHSSPITCATLHPNSSELIIGDQSGTIHLWLVMVTIFFNYLKLCQVIVLSFCYITFHIHRNLKNDRTEQLIPDQTSTVPIQDVCIDPSGKYLAAVNNKGDCYIWTLDGI